MGYRIEYEFSPRKKGKRGKGRLAFLTVLCFLAFFLFVNSHWPKGREVLQQVLLPGGTATWQALEGAAKELRQGASLEDTLELFCREIISEAGIVEN